MERLPVIMTINCTDKNKTMQIAQKYPIPKEFSIRNYKKGEEKVWAEIETSAGEFNNEEQAIERFEKEFGLYKAEMEKRCFFLIHNESNKAVGTATTWYNDDFEGSYFGRLHWVGIHSDFQGRKLAKPMLAHVMTCLAKYHDRAYLTSQTTSYKAINIYLDFGFIPEIMSDECERAWIYIEQLLGRQILKTRKNE